MDLLILLSIFAFLGYLIGVSRVGSGADRAAEKTVSTKRNWSDRIGERWNSLVNPRGFSHQFRDWATKDFPELFADDFKSWLTGLSDRELNTFVKALGDFSRGLDYDLGGLVEGDLDHDPRMRQVFVEAISVYSQAYRKAREANTKNTTAQNEANSKPQSENKPLAEKAPSRRTASNHNEPVEVASTD